MKFASVLSYPRFLLSILLFVLRILLMHLLCSVFFGVLSLDCSGLVVSTCQVIG